MLFIILPLLPLIYSGYFFMVRFSNRTFIKSKSTILLVTAHPDDECMFFAPTILNLLRQNCQVYLLCLTSGGFYNESTVRKKELRQSCTTLGIPSGNLIIIEHSHLPDNPNTKWSRVFVSEIVLKYIRHLSVNVVISFDKCGISGHLNHIAVSDSLEYLNSKRVMPQDCEIFMLETVSILQKYLGFLLVPLIFFCVNLSFASTFQDVKTTWKSMKDHKSQFVWFRKLYIVFSRYVYLNTFTKL